MISEIEITKPDDWHVHFRDNELLNAVVPQTSKYFGRAIVMPNLIPPILTGMDALKYKKRIEKAIPPEDKFKPLMTLYLREDINSEDLKSSFENGFVFAAKLYPAGATTNSDAGVKNIKKIMPILEIMAKLNMPLLIHGEVTDKSIDIFDREKLFIDTSLSFICSELPELKITLEHITTIDATTYVLEGNNIAASITPHHLALNRNAMFLNGIRPHFYCLPVLKREKHREALVKAATSGNKKFFLGTDSAPHQLQDKENSCGCAGIFNTINCIPILAQIFENEKSIYQLENFISKNGAAHYGLDLNKDKIKLIKTKEALVFNKTLDFQSSKISIFNPMFPVYWKIM